MRNVLVDSGDRGKLLLRCVRVYVELDLLVSFDVHTDETIGFGRKIADSFFKLANVRHSESIFNTTTTNTLT